MIANNIEDAIELAKIEMIKGYYPSCWDKLKQREKTWIKQTVEGEIVKRKDKKGETYFTIKNKLYLTEKTVKKKSKRGRDLKIRKVRRCRYETEKEAKMAMIKKIIECFPETVALKKKYKKELEEYNYEWIDIVIVDTELVIYKGKSGFKITPGARVKLPRATEEFNYVTAKLIREGDNPSDSNEEEEEEGEEFETEGEGEEEEEDEDEKDEILSSEGESDDIGIFDESSEEEPSSSEAEEVSD